MKDKMQILKEVAELMSLEPKEFYINKKATGTHELNITINTEESKDIRVLVKIVDNKDNKNGHTPYLATVTSNHLDTKHEVEDIIAITMLDEEDW